TPAACPGSALPKASGRYCRSRGAAIPEIRSVAGQEGREERGGQGGKGRKDESAETLQPSSPSHLCSCYGSFADADCSFASSSSRVAIDRGSSSTARLCFRIAL